MTFGAGEDKVRYDYRISVPDLTHHDAQCEWCDEQVGQCGIAWDLIFGVSNIMEGSLNYFVFKRHEDAIAFLIAWG